MKQNFEIPEIISGSTIYLRELKVNDASQIYTDWLNDKDINKYLESRYFNHTINSTKKFVENLLKSKNDYLFGIFFKDNNEHIGNIKLGDIDWKNLNANIGILIGSKKYWGKGIATESINLLTRFAFEILNLQSLSAGCYAENIGSKKAFLKAGWFIRGNFPNWRVNSQGTFTSEILLTITKDEILFFKPKLKKVTLIGAGELLIKTATYLVSKELKVLTVLAPRHHNEEFINKLNNLGCQILVKKDINKNKDVHEKLKEFNDLALCFGPAWVFDNEILEIFKNNIFNYNGIPLPNYLGGAHYTWQILNNNFEGGAFIQQITDILDRGPVVASTKYKVEATQKKPIFFEKINIEKGISLIISFFENIFLKSCLNTNNFIIDWDQLSYYPRLNTKSQAWINWSWDGKDIESFCNAFDEPYPGARTLLDKNTYIFKKVIFIKDKNIHPFCAGIIIKKLIKNNQIFIACKGGVLQVENLKSEDGTLLSENLKLGKRFYTNQSLLENSNIEVKYNSTGIDNDK